MTHPALRIVLPVALLWLGGCTVPPASTDPAEASPPAPMREFRAAWVATVANIDWPSEPGLDVATQQDEARAILDRLVALHMNAVIFQVRPQADAFYLSELEPWSAFLTGTQGAAPDPFYDPLAFWVDEAHGRGLQLHAWFNPYRANHPSNPSEPCAQSIVRARPELVVELGSQGYVWMDPARAEVQQHSLDVVLDVVQRYDVDGVHFDDYFYPYASYNDGEPFPDDASFAAYVDGGGALSRNDWRRAAVDTFIERVYRETKRLKPWVEFGISPFGIWRPGHPSSIRGLDQYDALYADAKRWLNEGWVDYFTPQLYWPIAKVPQSFPVLLGWWEDQNLQARHLWPGTSLNRSRGSAGATEIVNQIMITRGMTPASPGLCMFSMKSLLTEGSALAARLLDGPYADPALIPASPWLGNGPPAAAVVARVHDALTFRAGDGQRVFCWVVQHETKNGWRTEVLPGHVDRVRVEFDSTTRVSVTAVDRLRQTGTPSVWIHPTARKP